MDKEHKDLLVFGYGLGIIAAIFGVGGFFKHGLQPAVIVLMLCSIIFVGVTTFDWQALRPGYKGWMKVAHLIGTVVTTLILAAVFFAVFTPVAIALKIAGKDHLARRVNRSAKSYWRARPVAESSRERYWQQF